jgi:hypothetical protein
MLFIYSLKPKKYQEKKNIKPFVIMFWSSLFGASLEIIVLSEASRVEPRHAGVAG